MSRQVRGENGSLEYHCSSGGQPHCARGPARQLAAVVRDALDQIDAAARRISHRTPAGPLTLSCEPTLLMRWLIPRLPDVAVNVPDVAVHLSAGAAPFFERDNIDLAIRRDDFPFPEEASRTRLFAERIGPVCRPISRRA